MGSMTSSLKSHRLPTLELRAPQMPGGTAGPLLDIDAVIDFRDNLLAPSGVREPTVLAINLEGRFPSPAVLMELVIPLGRVARSRTHGPLAVVLCTTDEAVRTIVRAVAETHDLALFLAPSADRLSEAEAVGTLTATERETLEILRRLGGRVTVASFAEASGLEPSAATNRLVNVAKKGFVHRVERPRREGLLFVDPRVGLPAEDPADPTSGDYHVPEALRRDVEALANMQQSESTEGLASAWRDLMETNRDQLAADHDALRQAMERGDEEEIANFAKRYSKKQATARANRVGRR
jgi:hypothetical protein